MGEAVVIWKKDPPLFTEGWQNMHRVYHRTRATLEDIPTTELDSSRNMENKPATMMTGWWYTYPSEKY